MGHKATECWDHPNNKDNPQNSRFQNDLISHGPHVQTNAPIQFIMQQLTRPLLYWLLIQDDFTGYIWSLFLKAKSDLPDTMLFWLHQFQKDNSLTAQYIQYDNSGENVRLQRFVQEDKTLKT
jgi:hypothetical protein